MRGGGLVVCLIDPIGDVYACPFVIHEHFLAGNVRVAGFTGVWRESDLFRSLREPQSGGACARCGATTPAKAAAWRQSSSPACRSTDRIRVRQRPRREALAAVDRGRSRAGRRPLFARGGHQRRASA